MNWIRAGLRPFRACFWFELSCTGRCPVLMKTAPLGLIFKSAGGTANIVAVGFNRRKDGCQTKKKCRQVRYTWGDEGISKSCPIMMNHEDKKSRGVGKKRPRINIDLADFRLKISFRTFAGQWIVLLSSINQKTV